MLYSYSSYSTFSYSKYLSDTLATLCSAALISATLATLVSSARLLSATLNYSSPPSHSPVLLLLYAQLFRLGSGSLCYCFQTITSQPLNDALTADSCLYADHSRNRQISPLWSKIACCDFLCIWKLGARSLLKLTMHRLVLYMHTKKVDILRLQETKAKETSFLYG